MIPALDPATLSPQAQRIVAANAPEKLQEVAARGAAPGIRPAEIPSMLLVLARSERPAVRAAAEKTLQALPEPVLQGALSGDLPAPVIDRLMQSYSDRIDVLEKLIAMPRIAPETVAELAGICSESIAELVSTNEERLLGYPPIIERLYMNKHTRMSTADRLIELAARNSIELTGIPAWKEAMAAIKEELIPEPSPEPTPEDIAFKAAQELAERLASTDPEDTHDQLDDGEEELKKKFLPLYAEIAAMTVSSKVRTATLGSREARMLLVRDRNRVVATAAVRSPLMQEAEAALIARNRNMSDEVLRIIGTTPELMKSYTVKKALVENPKTPLMVGQRLVQHLRESDLKALAKSKNVTGPIKDAARRHLERRNS
jgi:hypothetical protein